MATNNNMAGYNGIDNGEKPDDDVLERSLIAYAREGLTLDERLERLASDHQYHIRHATLKKLNKRFSIATVRKPPPLQRVTQLIVSEVEKDVNRRRGPGTIKALLAERNIQIPRSVVRSVMLEHFPEDVDARYPGQKKIKRTQLTSLGVFEEVHADGHDKLASLALQMGPIGFPVYGFRDRFSGAILHLVVVPNNRLATTIRHVYLDFIEQYERIPMRITVDKGSETGEMYAMQLALRHAYAPGLDDEQTPAFMALKSTNNTPIESLWHWFREHVGRNLADEIKRGFIEGFFNPNNEIHIALVNWLWPPIVQIVLDEFCEYFNHHRVRHQKKKLMPSGATPLDIFLRPQAYGGERLSIPVTKEAIQALRADISVSRDEAFRFIDDDFAHEAFSIWEYIGAPPLKIENGWEVFKVMLPHFQHDTDNVDE